MSDVIVVGDLFVDLVMSGFPSWPRPGEESFATEYFREAGGGAAITACGLARLGSKVAVAGVVGDADGTFVLNRLRECGVDVAGIRTAAAEPTALTVSITGAADRSYFTYFGANRYLPELLNSPELHSVWSRSRAVHLACAPRPETLNAIASTVRATGALLTLDAGWHEDWLADPSTLRALSSVDVFMPNAREAERMTGRKTPADILGAFADAGLRGVALKRGGNGACLLWEGSVFDCEPYRVNVRDTTGAGDSFNAGFIHAWLRGDPPERCLRVGSMCGALSTEQLGGVLAFPEKQRLDPQ